MYTGLVFRVAALIDEGFHFDVIVSSLEEDFALKVDHLTFLGCAHGADECLEDVGAFLVVEQDSKLDPIPYPDGTGCDVRRRVQSGKEGSNRNRSRNRIEDLRILAVAHLPAEALDLLDQHLRLFIDHRGVHVEK